MTRNKKEKPQSSPNQGRNSDRTEGPGRGGRGRGRGGRGGHGGVNDDGEDDPSRGRGRFRGGGPSPPNPRGGPPPLSLDRGFGRGRGRGRGGWIGRGRGFGVDFGGFAGNFRGGGGRPMYHSTGEIDFEIQQWDESLQSGRSTPGGRGRGSSSKSSENNTPRGRGGHSGRGGYVQKLPSTSSLSSLWYEERPLLRPIKFVRSIETATLFQEAEELLESTVQNPDKSHIPTADKVSRVFSNTHPHLFGGSLLKIEEGIEEVNFEDLALVHEHVLDSAPAVQEEVSTDVIRKPALEPEVRLGGTADTTLATTETTIRTETEVATIADVEISDGPMIKAATDTTQSMTSVQDEPMVVETQATTIVAEPGSATISTGDSPLFAIDTDPSTSQKQIPIPTYNIHSHSMSLGENVKAEVEIEPDPEDDVIVYDAPNPRISTPKVELTMLTNSSHPNHIPSSTPRQINPLRKGKFVHVAGKNARRSSSGVTGVKRKRLTEHGKFAAFEAMIAEARLWSQGDGKDKDSKEHLRRQGDSDLDWGDETDEGESGPAIATAEGMDLDPDLVGSELTATAMERFVEGLNGNHVTMDDLEYADAEQDSSSDEVDEEDEDEDGIEDEDVEGDEERMLIEDFLAAQDGSDLLDNDEEDELDPRAGFQARLDRLRKKQQKMIEMGDDEDEDEIDSDFEWGEAEEIYDFVGGALNKHEKNRVARNAVFRAIQDGSFDELQPKASSSKRKDIPAELQEQWEKDRVKKAKRKSERELARLEAALDPLVAKKGGKKSRKAMIAAAKLDPSIEIPRQALDMDSVQQQIRQFLADKGRPDMALPACDKSTRKKVHELAALFGLTSKSKNGALGRYTTLFKTKHSGKGIDEREVAMMMEEFKYSTLYDVSDDGWNARGKGKGKGGKKGKDKGKDRGKEKGKSKEKDKFGHLRTKEGDVVGHAAPKIGEANIGFMMLASMGWSDGTTIGLSGGLDAPITAVIKKTKLGLGASVSTKF